MVSKILALIDFEKVNKLLEGFNKTTGFVTAILDLEGNVLSKSGWRQICTDFHRINPDTAHKCTISDTVLSSKLAQGEKYHFYECLNGLVDVAVPIIINGEHIANLFSGQFFFEKPKISFFEKQAKTYGFPQTEYLQALKNVPVVSKENVSIAMDFLLNMTQLISEITYQKLEQMNLNSALRTSKEQLFESEFRFNKFYENGPFGMVMADDNFKFKKANPAFCTIIGYSEEELKNLTFKEITHPDDLKKDMIFVKKLINKEINTYKTEKRYIRKDGKEIWGSLTVNSTYDIDGQFLYNLGIVEDITQKKLVQEALRLSELQYRNIFESAVVGMYRTTPDGKIIMANPTLIKMLGFDSFEDLAKRNLQFEGFENHTSRDIFRSIIDKNNSLSAFESVWKTKDGKLLHISENAKVFKDTEGNILYYEGTIEDITARKRTEQELIKAKEIAEESEIKYKQIFDNTFDIMSIYEVTEDKRFKVITFNHAEEKLIGSIENYRDKYIDECIPPALYQQFKVNYDRCIAEEKLIIYEEEISFQHIKKSFLTQLIPLKNNSGRIHRIIVISRDITENKVLNQQLTKQNEDLKLLNLDLTIAKEKAEESDKLKTAFINNISHEIRTPLNSILGFGQFLTEMDLKPEQREEYFNIIQNSSNRLMNTISDYMEMAMIVSGTVEIQTKNFSLTEFFHEINDFVSEQYIENNNQVLTNFPSESNEIILHSDKNYLRKILIILIENAQKFTLNGKIEFGYRIIPDFIEFFVKDTGCGIAGDKLELVFNMFSQENISNTRGHEGSGLGLTIAGGLVKLLGGKISVTSEKGVGSDFRFNIPFSNSAFLPFPSNLNSENSVKKPEPLILIAEDEESNYMYISAILKKMNCNFIHVKNGEDAVKTCRENQNISLVLMDIKMPVMNGADATIQIRKFKPNLPIIALTAYAQSGDENRFLEMGCNAYISKPVKNEILISTLKKFTGN